MILWWDDDFYRIRVLRENSPSISYMPTVLWGLQGRYFSAFFLIFTSRDILPLNMLYLSQRYTCSHTLTRNIHKFRQHPLGDARKILLAIAYDLPWTHTESLPTPSTWSLYGENPREIHPLSFISGWTCGISTAAWQFQLHFALEMGGNKI